jgi:patatin-like phospholipase/acyl hydrolase
MFAYGDKKTQVLKLLSELTSELTEDHATRRILQLDGGGVRGLFSILELCVLEEIINNPVNKEVKTRLLKAKKDRIFLTNMKDDCNRLYIRDLFDVGTGTSTAAILILEKEARNM